MGFLVFLSHSLDPAEQALAWRLQTLAAAHGIEVYVPRRDLAPASHAQQPSVVVRSAIDRSDCVMAIITAEANPNVQEELRYALAKRKPIIPIVHSNFMGHPLVAQFPHVFTFSPWESPGKVEGDIVEFLKNQQISNEKQQAIGALAAVALGLLLLFSLSEK